MTTDALHWAWHTITTRPGVSYDALCEAWAGERREVLDALASLLWAGYVTERGGAWYPLVPFVLMRQGWLVEA